MAFLELACALKSVTRANVLMGLPRPDNSRNTFGIWRFSPLHGYLPTPDREPSDRAIPVLLHYLVEICMNTRSEITL